MKVKVVPHCAMKTHEVVQLNSFLTSVLDGREWLVSCPRYPTFQESCAYLVGTSVSLNAEAKGRILCPCQESNLDHPVRSRHYADSAPTSFYDFNKK
jgi:hypothetical protein